MFYPKPSEKQIIALKQAVLRDLRFRVLGSSFFVFWGFRVLDLRFRVFGSSFFVLGSSFSCFGVFVFVFWGLRTSIFVFSVFVFYTTIGRKRFFGLFMASIIY